MKPVIISILTHNKLDYTVRCLSSIFNNTSFPPFEVVITDNAYSDWTVDHLKIYYKDRIKLIENQENKSFSEAHNTVIKQYPKNDVVLMNNDIEVPENWLATLSLECFRNGYGAVSPAIKVSNGLNVGAVLDGHARGRSLINVNDEPDWITGSCIFIPRKTINRVGYLDESFNFYYEDVDYCFRIKQEGLKICCISEIVIIHADSVSSTTEKKRQMLEKSRRYFAEKWGFKKWFR